MLKSNLHNSQQNYIALSEQLIALQMLNEASTSTNMIQIPKFKDSDSACTEGFNNNGYLPFKSLDYSKSARFVLPETLRSSSKMYPQNLVFNNQKLLTSLLKIWQKAKAQISQCTLKCCTQDLIRLLVASNPTLKNSKITTESEQKLLKKVDQLEKSNKSLRQNLLDTINDLKSTEKENEAIFAEKLKLLKQIGENLEGTSYSHRESEARPPMSEEIDGFEQYNDPFEEEDLYNISREIEIDNDLFHQNASIIEKTDNMINKYNSVVKKNQENIRELSDSSQSLVRHKNTTNLHSIEEDKREEEISRQSLEFMMKSKQDKEAQKPKISSKEEIKKEPKISKPPRNVSKQKKDPKTKPVVKEKKRPITKMEDAEAEIKETYDKNLPPKAEFFERRNKQATSNSFNAGTKKKGKQKSQTRRLFPDHSYERDTISTSSRVYEKKNEKSDDGVKDKEALKKELMGDLLDDQPQFKIRKKKNPKPAGKE